MNILMIHPHDIYSSSEPWTIRIKNIAHEFIKKGHSVKLVYFPLDKRDAYRRISKDNVEVISMDRRVGLLVLLRNIIWIVKLAEKCDIIHFQKCLYHATVPALIAAWIKNKPIHYDWDDWETKIFYYSNPKQIAIGQFVNTFEKLIPKIVDTISVASGHLHGLCVRRGAHPENIFPAHVGADLQLFNPNRDGSYKIKQKYNIKDNLVLYIGQLHGGQYAELFIKAAHIIAGRGYNATFMIVGGGYRKEELKKMAWQLNLNEHYIFTGSVDHNMIPSYIAAADVCVACFENNDITKCKSPLKIVEYLACGKAIVASNVGEVRNMVGGVGVLTEAGDPKSLSDGIIHLLRDKGLRERMGKRARERVERKYNWSVTAGNLIRAYEKAVNLKEGVKKKEVA